MKLTVRRAALAGLGLAVLAAAVAAFLPGPLGVDTAPVRRGPLRVTVDEEGETRARERYVVAAPVAGRLERVTLVEGAEVRRGQAVAAIHLAPMDPRELEAARARLRAVQALEREAVQIAERAETDAAQARRDRERAEQLFARGYLALQEAEQARSAEAASVKAREAARYRARAAASDVEVVRASLLASGPEEGGDGRELVLRSPVGGRVLRVIEQSERVLPAGTPILIVGDPAALEIVTDVLSTDAVRIRPGMPVLLEGWGGPRALRARVRTVEPAAFTKISALGIEEQRVNVVADLDDPPGALGDGYRVEARIVVWSSDAALQAPASAFFREAAGEGWAVFTAAGGRARKRSVEIGQRTDAAVEVLAGVAEGEHVVLHPPGELRDGARVKEKPAP